MSFRCTFLAQISTGKKKTGNQASTTTEQGTTGVK